MKPSDNEIFEKYAKQCMQCLRNTFLPYEYDFTCISGG